LAIVYFFRDESEEGFVRDEGSQLIKARTIKRQSR
jgi:hypothetical protein